jgi:hypothetical protein
MDVEGQSVEKKNAKGNKDGKYLDWVDKMKFVAESEGDLPAL